MAALHTLQNKHWQIGILPETGASVAFARMRYSGAWVDILRPTQEADYGNSSLCSSFVMLPWANRIKGGQLRVLDQTYQLQTTPDDGTARHGDVRKRTWQIDNQSETAITLQFDAVQHENVNFPFAFRAHLTYQLDEADFIISTALENTDTRPFVAGFGHHPYFVRPADADNTPQVQIPCAAYFPLTDTLITGAPQPLIPNNDYRQARALDDTPRDDLFTQRTSDQPARIIYPAWRTALEMHADDLYRHFLLFAPTGQPFFALEPQTNANDGFNYWQRDADERGDDYTGVFMLEAGQTRQADIRLRLTQLTT